MKERLIRKFFNPNYSFNMLRHTISSRSHVRNPLYTPETPPERPIFSSHSWQPCQHDPVPSLFPISYTVLSRSLASSLNPLLPSSPSVVSQNDGSEIRFLSSQADFEFFKSIVYVRVYMNMDDNPRICLEKGEIFRILGSRKLFHVMMTRLQRFRQTILASVRWI